MPAIAPPTSADFAAARKRIERAQRILLLTHIGPDSDAIGSLLGMAHLLRAIGKDVVAACADPAPDYTRFMPGIESVTANPSGTFDLVISLDAADLSRLGALGARFAAEIQIVFDHHITNPGFGAVNLIDPEAASTAELVAAHLDDLGLAAAIEWAVQNFTQRHQVACTLEMDEGMELQEPYATAVFRIVQESLVNVAKHAAATQVVVRVTLEGDQVTLQVRDNGRGFDVGAPRKAASLGLAGLRERAHLLKGTLQIDSVPGTGTTVQATIPVAGADALEAA